MSATIAAPVAGPFLTAFLDARRTMPWPMYGEGNARAAALYTAYSEAATEAGLTKPSAIARVGDSAEPLLSPRDFGLALKELGFKTDRDTAGNFYPALLPMTRDELARERVREEVSEPVWFDLYDQSEARHMETFDHGTRTIRTENEFATDDEPKFTEHEEPKPCECDIQQLVNERSKANLAALDAFMAAREEDGTIDRLVEEEYGPFLRWRPGDEDPTKAWRKARNVAARAARLAEAYPGEKDELIALVTGWNVELARAKVAYDDVSDLHFSQHGGAHAAWERAIEKAGFGRYSTDVTVARKRLAQLTEDDSWLEAPAHIDKGGWYDEAREWLEAHS